MNPYDTEKVRAVWQRVMAQDGDEAMKERLLELIAGEYAARRNYEKMAAQSGAYGAVLRRMAREEEQHARRLSALYDLLYGPMPRLATAVAEKEKLVDFHESVRRSFRRELSAAERYGEMADRLGQHRALFQTLAADARRHSRQLGHIAQNLIFSK